MADPSGFHGLISGVSLSRIMIVVGSPPLPRPPQGGLGSDKRGPVVRGIRGDDRFGW